MRRTCEVCGAAAALACSACHLSHYCSSDHRKRHWEEAHRHHCRPMSERSDTSVGRYMVTSRDVQAGELVLVETPIALGPGSTSQLICLGCHQYITGAEFPRCPSCWWPLCSSACASSSLHRAECPVLAVDTRRIGQPTGPGSTPRYDIILVLRCLLLRETDPPAWRRLLDMASHAQRRAQEGEPHHAATTRYIREVLKVDYEDGDVHHGRDAIITNCFEWVSPTRESLRGVYPLLARLNHSCRPNVTVLSDCDGTMYARAATDLRAGEQLNITYTNSDQPLWERREYTRQVHYFTCDCIRCDDPTELGLHMSSPRCEHCRSHFLEATTWLEEVTWECSWCGLQRQEAVIRMEAEQWLSRFEGDDAFATGGPRSIKNTLEKVAEAFHPFHYVWVRAAQVAVCVLKRDPSIEAVTLRRHLWLRLLRIFSVLEPGLSKRRGMTLYETGLAHVALTRLERDGGLLTDYFFRLQMMQSLEYLQEATHILNLEPERSRERRWYNRAKEAASDVAQELGVALPPARGPPVVVAEDGPLQKRIEMTESGTCGLCGAAATLRCGGCSSVHYCGKDHQRKHWAKHKDECWPVTQMHDSRVGRYLVASRNLEEGQLVIREEPLVLGPTADSWPLCLGCHTPITAEDFPRCPGCSWPLCSPDCADGPRHKAECAVLATDTKRIGPPTSLMVTPRYDVILVLRCLLLRSSNPSAWKRIKSMGSHAESRWQDQEPHHCAVVKYFTDVLEADCDEETARHLHGAIITNSINTCCSPGGVTLRGIYPSVCLMNHSCHPNATLRSTVSSTLYVRTAVPVKKGEPLKFSYVPPADPLWRRQADLSLVYYFKCDCQRCMDPTELGTHFSSPRCPECREGFLDPNEGPGAPWSCSKCEKSLPEEEIKKEVEAYEREIETKCASFTEACKLLDNIKVTFHMNHFVWMKAAKAVLTTMREKSKASLAMQRDLWRRLIQLHERLEPGSTRRRGVSLYYAGVVEKEAALLHLTESGANKPSEVFEDGMTRAIRMLDTSIQILSYEPPDSTEIRWLHKAKAEKQDIYELIGGNALNGAGP